MNVKELIAALRGFDNPRMEVMIDGRPLAPQSVRPGPRGDIDILSGYGGGTWHSYNDRDPTTFPPKSGWYYVAECPVADVTVKYFNYDLCDTDDFVGFLDQDARIIAWNDRPVPFPDYPGELLRRWFDQFAGDIDRLEPGEDGEPRKEDVDRPVEDCRAVEKAAERRKE